MGDSFGFLGYVILAVYMTATVLLGLSFARRQKSLEGYFLAGRSTPWWAVGISLIACDMSAISYMGSPAWTYYHDLRYALATFVVPAVAVVVANLFVPFLARLNVYTIYEYLEHRFGLGCRLFASAVFLLQRAMHLAIAVYAIALALQQIVGWPVWACVTIIGGLTTFYTVLGGMKAVLWTDVMQFFVLVGSIVVMLGMVLWAFRGDLPYIWQTAAAAGHTKLLTISFDPWNWRFWLEMTIWGILLGTFVSLVGAYGSDQVLVQRYIAAGSARLMAQSLLFSSVVQIPVSIMLYALGIGFFAYYHSPQHAELLASLEELVARTGNTNMLLPHFVRNVLPSGLAGLVFAGLFAATMSVFSSGVNSLATVICIDFIQRLRQRSAPSPQVTIVKAQWVTLACGIAITLAAVGVHLMQIGSLLAAASGVIGFFTGPLLGMFLLGMFSLRASSFGAVVGALCGFGVALLLCDAVSFIWYPVVGCAPTLIVGSMLSFFSPATAIDAYSMTVWGRGTQLPNTHIEKFATKPTGEQE